MNRSYKLLVSINVKPTRSQNMCCIIIAPRGLQ